MDALRYADAVLALLPNITDAVIFGSMALAAAVIYTVSFLGIVGSFYRTASPLVPPTKAAGAALTMLAPVAVLWVILGETARKYAPEILPPSYSAGLVLASVFAPILALWPAALLLTAWPPFRDAQMPAPPAASPAAARRLDFGQAEEGEEAGEAEEVAEGKAEGKVSKLAVEAAASRTPSVQAGAAKAAPEPATPEVAQALATKKED